MFQMLLYTSLGYYAFQVLVGFLSRFKVNYISGWDVTCFSQAEQVLMTLMKLRLNLRDLDLADRFCVSRTTVSNVQLAWLYMYIALEQYKMCYKLGHNL